MRSAAPSPDEGALAFRGKTRLPAPMQERAMRMKLAAAFALLLASGLLSGCVIEPDWGWHHRHHDHYDHY